MSPQASGLPPGPGRSAPKLTIKMAKTPKAPKVKLPFRQRVRKYAIRGAITRSRAVLHLDSEMRGLKSRYQSLTPRERDVMTLVVSGLLNKQVGGELGISEVTVKAHRGQVMRKMQADSLAALVKMSTKLGVDFVATADRAIADRLYQLDR